ncbi:MAG: cation transporter [Sebaldella sp.]|nr:cation transporter [Sebaldella sp.]
MHKHSHFHQTKANNETKNIKMVFFLNLAFTIIEFIGGSLTNSVAIMSDAVHDFGDCFTLASSWFLEEYSTKKDDKKYTYGYRRYALIGAVINSVILFIGSIFIIIEAAKRIGEPQEVESLGMIFLAVIGVLVNGLAALKLKSTKKITERTVMLHLLEDVLGWVAVLIASICIWLFNITFLDPILSLLIAAFILSNVYKNFKETAKIFLQAVPDGYDILNLQVKMKRIKGVLDIHDIHLWSLDGVNNIISLHCVVIKDLDIEKVNKIKLKLKRYLNHIRINHATIEIEYENL